MRKFVKLLNQSRKEKVNVFLIVLFFLNSFYSWGQKENVSLLDLEVTDISDFIVNKENIFFFSLPNDFGNNPIAHKIYKSYSRVEEYNGIKYLTKYEDYLVDKNCKLKLGSSVENGFNIFILKLIGKNYNCSRVFLLKENFKISFIKARYVKDNRYPQLLFFASNEKLDQYFRVVFQESNSKKINFSVYH